MKVLSALLAVVGLVLLAVIGVGAAGMHWFFGIFVPYAAFAVFVTFFVYRVVKWARSPVPYRIPTTSGQQQSLDFIKPDNLEAPYNTAGVVKRMFLEIFLFRSLFRNTRAELREVDGEARLAYASSKWLWLGGLAFHAAFFVILLRHLRFFVQPVPFFVEALEGADGFFQMTLPALYLTDLAIVAALTYLFLRRLLNPQVRYISLANDYFPLLLIIAIAASGMLMRHVYRIDVVGVKELAMGLASFSPVSSEAREGIRVIFYVHFFLVSALIAYFPFSKLMHAGGVFLSPTRNLTNDSRARRHVNPWNHDVKVHTYAEYEDEFREVMKAAELPVERE